MLTKCVLLSLALAVAPPAVSGFASLAHPRVHPLVDGLHSKSSKSSDDTKDSSQEPVDQAVRARFAQGSELAQLRVDLKSLRENLQWALSVDDQARVEDLTQAIQAMEDRDPERVYAKSLRQIANIKASHLTSRTERNEAVTQWQNEAQTARQCLARFSLDGLWVGK
jgi:hypothetical protein